jgi:hypothetical protein
VALQNIQKESFYYRDTIVNVFLEVCHSWWRVRAC